MLTLNQVLDRLRTIVSQHQLVRSYEQIGLKAEGSNIHTVSYPHVSNLVNQSFAIGKDSRMTSFSFILTFLDLVHVAADTDENGWDVISDMTSLATDIFAQLLNPELSDWKISGDGQLQPVYDDEHDEAWGVQMTFTVQIPFTANQCQVPTTFMPGTPTEDDMGKPVYDIKYVATGNEGSSIDTAASSVLNAITGKKILLVTRESSPLHKVSNNPDPAEYTWNDTVLSFGTTLNIGERILILYRNY